MQQCMLTRVPWLTSQILIFPWPLLYDSLMSDTPATTWIRDVLFNNLCDATFRYMCDLYIAYVFSQQSHGLQILNWGFYYHELTRESRFRFLLVSMTTCCNILSTRVEIFGFILVIHGHQLKCLVMLKDFILAS